MARHDTAVRSGTSIRHELGGAVADVGVLVPIAVALIVSNGLSPTAVLLPAALLYLANAAYYRLPLPAQPLKAFGAIAIAEGLGADEIAAGALLMGALFLTAGRLGIVDRAALAFPRPLVRGVQLTVGLLFLKIAWGLVSDPPASFAEHALAPAWAVPLAFAAAAAALVFRRAGAALALVLAGAIAMVATAGSGISFGPSAITTPSLDLRNACARLLGARDPPGAALLRQLLPRHGRRGPRLLRRARGPGASRPARVEPRTRQPLRGRDQRDAGLPRRGRTDGALLVRRAHRARAARDGIGAARARARGRIEPRRAAHRVSAADPGRAARLRRAPPHRAPARSRGSPRVGARALWSA